MEHIQDNLLEGIDIDSYLDEIAQPEHILSGSGFAWYYSDTRRTMVRVKRGSECVVFDTDIEDNSKVLVQIGNEILLIDSNEIIEIGWN